MGDAGNASAIIIATCELVRQQCVEKWSFESRVSGQAASLKVGAEFENGVASLRRFGERSHEVKLDWPSQHN